MWKRCPKKTLDAFIHFHTLSYALEGFTCFHMLLYALISFYMNLYAFICFYMLLYPFQHFHIHFYTLLHAFIHFLYAFLRIQTQKSKTSPRPPPPPSTYTNVWLSRCAAGKNAAPTFSVFKKKLWLDIFYKMLKNKTRGGYPFLASPSKKIASHAKGGYCRHEC